MGDKRQKRSRAEKEAKKALKKLRKNAEAREQKQAAPEITERRIYGPAKPPDMPRQAQQQKPVIGPEIPEFLQKPLLEEIDESETEIGPEMPNEDNLVMETSGNGNEVVGRVLNILEKGSFVDPYEILGLEISPDTANDAAVKKAYRKCSLAVHPDKCSHPQAQKAFQAISEAWKSIQSADHRSALERKRDDTERNRQAEIEVRREQRQQEWSQVMNPGISKAKPKGREEWMTQLPQMRRQPAVMKQVNVSSFSRKEYADVTDNSTSLWTQSPTQQSAPSLKSSKDDRPPSLAKPQRRGTSLLEKHQLKLKQTEKRKSMDTTTSTDTSFSYRPFDREKDLEVKKGRREDSASILKDMGSLASRFQ